MNVISIPEGCSDLHEYLTHAPTITKLLIIENEMALDSKAYTYGQINKLLSLNYQPGDFNYVPFIQSDADLQQAFSNAHRAQSNSSAPYYTYPCAQCHNPIVLNHRQQETYSRCLHYYPKFCPECCSSITA